MIRTTALLLALFSSFSATHADVRGYSVEYTVGETKLQGYIAYDTAIKTKRPGIIVVHEWWGHNEYARKRARMLAQLGYTAFALDMYGDGKQASHPDDAAQFAHDVRKNLPVAKQRFEAALALLREHETTNPDQIGVIGYCFGGGVALEMARMGEDLDGVVTFHGSLDTSHPAKPGDIKAKILVLTGAEDPFVPPELIKTFEDEMRAAKVDYRIVSYPGAEHSFSNPEATAIGQRYHLPLAYNRDADEKSWDEMRLFFKQLFKPETATSSRP